MDGTAILIIRVEPGDSVHTNQAGECFLRIGDESRKLSLGEFQELSCDRGGLPFEASAVPLRVEDLDRDQADAYAQTMGPSGIAEMLAARDLITRRGDLTVAASLLFDSRPQREYPSAYVRVLRYDGDDRGLGSSMTLREDLRFDGSLPTQISAAHTAIEDLVPTRQPLQPSGRFERVPVIPRDAWLEGLVNAVVHRSYSIMGDHIRVEIFDHRIEITSPGRFPGLVDPTKPLTISRYARNPRIARVCSDLGFTRELGEGIRRIFAEMRSHSLTTPIYRQSSASVTLTLSSADAIAPEILHSLTPSAKKALNALRLAGTALGTGEIAELTEVARPTAARAMRQLEEAGLVQWDGTSPRDPRASWTLL